MRIETRKIDELIPAIYNPRKDLTQEDAEYKKIKRSIEAFGYVDPVIVNERTDTVVGGHQRLKVLKDLGYTEIEVSVVDLTDEQEKALNVALNKISGEWDFALLKDLLEDLDTGNFDLELTGFDLDEIEGLMTQFHMEDEPSEVEEDDFDSSEFENEGYEPITKRGDIWKLGKHRLMCGDSTHLEDIEKLMNGEKADLVYTDPPYGVSYQSNMSKRFEVIKNDDVFLDFIAPMMAVSNNDIHWYIWTSHHVYPTWRNMFEDYYKHTIVWDKGGGGMGDLEGNYASDYELAIFCHYGRRKLEGKREGAVWSIGKDNNNDYIHPTQKPVALAAKAINNSSKKNAIVLDLFGGSGSTLMACEQLGRRARVNELDERYCDAIIKRWEELTGEKAVRLNG